MLFIQHELHIKGRTDALRSIVCTIMYDIAVRYRVRNLGKTVSKLEKYALPKSWSLVTKNLKVDHTKNDVETYIAFYVFNEKQYVCKQMTNSSFDKKNRNSSS